MSLQANAFIDFQVHTICIFFGVHPCTLTKRIETIQELQREHHYQEKYLSKRSPLKHTCSCHDKLIVVLVSLSTSFSRSFLLLQ